MCIRDSDWAVQPIIQSGGKYDLKLSAEPDDSNLHAGVILATLGLRYQTYSSIIARTYLVDPNKSQESAYKLLLSVHDSIIKNARDGAIAKDVYTKALDMVRSKKPELEKHFVKSVGYGVGIETRDSALALNAKNTSTLRDGMTLTITTGLNDIQNPNSQDNKSNKYSLVLTDTVRVGGNEGMVFTKDAPTDLESTSFFFNDEDEEEEKKPKAKKDPRVGAVAQTNIKSTRLRHERATNAKDESDAARREHQRELHQKKQRDGLETYGAGTGNLNGTEEKKFKRFESYKQPNQFPTKVKDLMVIVDPKSSSIILPIMGRPVPFHINTIKNVSQTQEPGGVTFLRINFLSPGQGVGRKDDQPFEDASAHFVRSMTFRSSDANRMDSIVSQITDMKKSSVRREQEKKEMEDVVEQDKLVEIRSKSIRPLVVIAHVLIVRRPPSPPLGQHFHAACCGEQAHWRVSRDTPERYPIYTSWWHEIRHPIQQHQASLFPTLGSRIDRHHPHASTQPYHHWKAQDERYSILPRSHRDAIR